MQSVQGTNAMTAPEASLPSSKKSVHQMVTFKHSRHSQWLRNNPYVFSR